MSDKKIMGGTALKNRFDAYYDMVLCDRISEIPKQKKGERAKFIVLKPLPTKEDYHQLKRKRFTYRLDDMVNNISGLTELGDEVRGWYDNLPESFQQGDKGSMLDECASTLENIQEPNVPEFAVAMAVYAPPLLDCNSRSDRRDAITHDLQNAITALEEAIETGKFKTVDGDEIVVQKGDDDEANQVDEIQSLVDELQTICEEAEGVEFPSMYS